MVVIDCLVSAVTIKPRDATIREISRKKENGTAQTVLCGRQRIRSNRLIGRNAATAINRTAGVSMHCRTVWLRRVVGVAQRAAAIDVVIETAVRIIALNPPARRCVVVG